MSNFKRTLHTTTIFLLLVVLVTEIIVYPYFHSETYHYQDGYVRESMAGEIELIVCGASQAQRGISPIILDEKLDMYTYNIGTPLLTIMGRHQILQKEIERNPVEMVIIELCYDTLVRDRDIVNAEGEYYMLGRMINFEERAEYFFKAARLEEYADFYYDTLTRGIESWKQYGQNKIGTSTKYTSKGFEPLETYPIPMPEKENFGKEQILTELSKENLEYLDKIFELCKENNIKVVMISTPLSDSAVMSYDKLDVIHEYYKEISQKWNCEYYNFSLYKGKSTLFNDQDSYFDRNHLSTNGAIKFSNLLADVLVELENGNSSKNLFYESYEQAIKEEIIPLHNLNN